MKSAAKKTQAVVPGERDLGQAEKPGAPEDGVAEPGGPPAAETPESPGEQTVVFRAVTVPASDAAPGGAVAEDAAEQSAQAGPEQAGSAVPGSAEPATAPVASGAESTAEPEPVTGPAAAEAEPVAAGSVADAAEAAGTETAVESAAPVGEAAAAVAESAEPATEAAETGAGAAEAAAESVAPAAGPEEEAGPAEPAEEEEDAAGPAQDAEAETAAAPEPGADDESDGEPGDAPAVDDESGGEPETAAEPAAPALEAEPASAEAAAEAAAAEPDQAADGSDAAEAYVTEEPLPEPVSEALTAALAGLRASVAALHFGLELPGAREARKAQAELLAQLDDYVLPRVRMSTAPALAVIIGSTGAGKSTLVNTLAAAKVSPTGVRRPTTGVPVLVCNPADRDWFAGQGVLSGFTRLPRPTSEAPPDSLVLVESERVPAGLALLDTPDIDSVVEEHHEIARRMLDAADLWIFVTTAARYADAPSWRLLRLAKERSARLAIVLSRVPPKSREVVVKHFARMLGEYGLGEVERFVINETAVNGGRLPDEEVTELRLWLAELSVDEQRRAQAVRTTLEGVLNSFRTRVPALGRYLEAQVAFRAKLRSDVETAFTEAQAAIERAVQDGSLLRGEVLARWQDFTGSGDLLRSLHIRRPGRPAAQPAQQTPVRVRALRAALRTALESVIISAAQRAAEQVVGRWRQRDAAGERLAATPGLGRPSEEFIQRTARTIGAWQDHVVELVRDEGVAKRSVARLVSYDVDALALVFTVGLLGYGTAEGTSGGLPQRLLRGLLGAESLRNIGAKARNDLHARIGVLFDDEAMRYVQALDSAGIPDEAAATRLYQATYNLEVAR